MSSWTLSRIEQRFVIYLDLKYCDSNLVIISGDWTNSKCWSVAERDHQRKAKESVLKRVADEDNPCELISDRCLYIIFWRARPSIGLEYSMFWLMFFICCVWKLSLETKLMGVTYICSTLQFDRGNRYDDIFECNFHGDIGSFPSILFSFKVPYLYLDQWI